MPLWSTAAVLLLAATPHASDNGSPNDAAPVAVPLYHFDVDGALSDGVWVNISLGTPAQPLAVLFDTGSSTLAAPPLNLPEAECQRCPAIPGPCQYPPCAPDKSPSSRDCVFGAYTPAASSTGSFLSGLSPACGTAPLADSPSSMTGDDRCPVAVMYGSDDERAYCHQGFVGDVAHDIMAIGGLSAVVPLVSITTIQSGFQEPPCAGIMGVAFNALNVLGGAMVSDPDTDEATTADDVTAEPDAFGAFLAGAGMANEFSLCMGGPGSPGVLVLGGVDPEYQAGAFQTVGILPGAGYAVPVTEVTVGRHRLGGLDADEQAAIFAGTGAIVDSGTPELVLPGLVYSAMASSIVPCTHNGDCVIGITLSGGVTLAAPGLATCSAGGTCRATRWIRSSGGPQAILGFAVIRNYYTHFDRSARTLGFAQGASGCARAVLPALHAFGADGSVDGSSEGPDELMESKCIQCMDPARGDPDPLSNPEGDDSYGTNKEVDHESKAVVSADSGGQGGNDGGALEAAPAAAADRYPHRSASSDEAYDAVVVTILVATVALLVAVATWRVRRARRAGSESDSPTAMTLLDNEQTDGADSDQENPF